MNDLSWTTSCSLALAADSGSTASTFVVAAMVLISAWPTALSREDVAAAFTVLSVASISITIAFAILATTTTPSSIFCWTAWGWRWWRWRSTSIHGRRFQTALVLIARPKSTVTFSSIPSPIVIAAVTPSTGGRLSGLVGFLAACTSIGVTPASILTVIFSCAFPMFFPAAAAASAFVISATFTISFSCALRIKIGT